MRITVIGGTGLIGSRLVRMLQSTGHETVVASRATGVNSYTGEGLEEVLYLCTLPAVYLPGYIWGFRCFFLHLGWHEQVPSPPEGEGI